MWKYCNSFIHYDQQNWKGALLDQVPVSLLSSFHERGRGTQLQISPCLDKEVSNITEATTAGQGQRSFLGFLRLGIDVCSY